MVNYRLDHQNHLQGGDLQVLLEVQGQEVAVEVVAVEDLYVPKDLFPQQNLLHQNLQRNHQHQLLGK